MEMLKNKGTKRQERFKKSTGYIQKKHPFPVTSCGRRRPFMYKERAPQTKKGIDIYSKQSLSPKVDMAHHISGIRPNLRGEMYEYKRKKLLEKYNE